MKTIQDELREANERITAIVGAARTEDRDFSVEEQKEVDDITARMRLLDGKRVRNASYDDLMASVQTLAAVPARPGNGGPHVGAGLAPFNYAAWPAAAKSLGAQFVEHEVYATLRNSRRGGNWSTPVFELQNAASVTGVPPAFIPPGVVLPPAFPTSTPQWSVAALFSQSGSDGGYVPYLRETVWTNAAVPVAMGAPKPESTLTFALAQAPFVKIAHWIPVPDELLEDIAGLQGYINARLSMGVEDAQETQVISGDGGAGHMQGLLTLPGITAATVYTAGPYATAIETARAAIFAASRLAPDAVVMNPVTWALVSSQVSTAGGYLAGPGVFQSGVQKMIWGLKVVESPRVVAGTAIVGAFKEGGIFYTKGGLEVQATNSHAELFISNVTAIRAEQRAVLVIYRPSAFGLVTGLVAA